MMKKICNWVSLFLVFLPFLFGCSQSHLGKQSPLSLWMADNGKIKVLSTTSQIADLVEEIGGDRIDSWTLIGGLLDPHSYELVKGDGEKMERAQLIFYNGLGLEHGASLSAWLSSEKKAIPLGDRIRLLSPEKLLRRGPAIDPHIWTDISLWKEVAEGVTETLVEFDPEGAAGYRERSLALLSRMEETHQEIRALLHTVPKDKRYLVTSHDAFHYFGRSYLAEEGEEDWVLRVEAPEGLSPDGQLSPVDIQRIILYLRKYRVSVLFPESNVNRDSIKKISSAGKELGLDVCICRETLYGDGMEKGLRYLDMMKHNAKVITEYLRAQ
jgi:manganese/zinc/iron transport system substrate-binding protein